MQRATDATTVHVRRRAVRRRSEPGRCCKRLSCVGCGRTGSTFGGQLRCSMLISFDAAGAAAHRDIAGGHRSRACSGEATSGHAPDLGMIELNGWLEATTRMATRCLHGLPGIYAALQLAWALTGHCAPGDADLLAVINGPARPAPGPVLGTWRRGRHQFLRPRRGGSRHDPGHQRHRGAVRVAARPGHADRRVRPLLRRARRSCSPSTFRLTLVLLAAHCRS